MLTKLLKSISKRAFFDNVLTTWADHMRLGKQLSHSISQSPFGIERLTWNFPPKCQSLQLYNIFAPLIHFTSTFFFIYFLYVYDFCHFFYNFFLPKTLLLQQVNKIYSIVLAIDGINWLPSLRKSFRKFPMNLIELPVPMLIIKKSTCTNSKRKISSNFLLSPYSLQVIVKSIFAARIKKYQVSFQTKIHWGSLSKSRVDYKKWFYQCVWNVYFNFGKVPR